MIDFFVRSLMGKLVLSFTAFALIPVILVGYISYRKVGTALKKRTSQLVTSARKGEAIKLIKYFDEAVIAARFLAEYDSVKTTLKKLPSSGEETGKSTPEQADGQESSKNQGILTKVSLIFSRFEQTIGANVGYEDILLIRPDGEIIASAKKLADLGENITSDLLKDSGLGKVWKMVMETQKPVLEDFSVYNPAGEPAAFIAVPVFTTEDKKLCGVLALRLGAKRINEIIGMPKEAGKTGEIFVVGSDFLMRTSGRFHGSEAILKKKVENEAVKSALLSKEGEMIAKDQRGKSMIISFSNVGLNKIKTFVADFDWAIIAKVDYGETITPAKILGWRIFVTSFVVVLIVVLMAVFMAHGIAKPVAVLARVATDVSKGDLTVEFVNANRKDEIGTLSQSMRTMVQNLRNQIRRTLEGVNVIASSAAEISTTVAQLAASTSKTSAALTETTTTVEEVKQAAKLASEKAKNVTQNSSQAVEISESGRVATEDTVQKMNLIKEQMESIGETVVRLSEHSQAIEEIIAAVQDLADQSNLLAVNASIEAARAGDHGKGFTVVAHEIKNLADQSKEATEQVRSILHDTRKWVSAVVMATEQGAKAVDAGVEQSHTAGESIQSLARSVDTASQSASVIEASVEQQFTGIDQVSSAMVNIEQAMQQNLAGTTQLEEASRRLEGLGANLKEIVVHYQV